MMNLRFLNGESDTAASGPRHGATLGAEWSRTVVTRTLSNVHGWSSWLRSRTRCAPTFMTGRSKFFANSVLGFAVMFVLLAAPLSLAADDIDKNSETLRLSLKNGGYVLGSPLPSDKAGEIRWRSSQFDRPLSFDIRALRSISGSDSPPSAVTGHSFLLESGTRVSGKLLQWTEDVVSIETTDCGVLELDRLALRSVESNEIVGRRMYSGPKSIDQWSILPKTTQWENLSGSLVTKVKGARLASDVNLPSKFRLSLAMSWTENPDFVLAIGCEKPVPKSAPKQNQAGFRVANAGNAGRRNYGTRIEMWDAHLATVREVGNLADIAVLPLEESSKRFDLTFYIDQVAGVVAIYSNRGRMLEKIVVPGQKGSENPYVLLENFGQQISLDKFEVFEWDGHLPESMDFPDSYVLNREDKIIQGEITGYDAESDELTLTKNEGGTETLKLDGLRRCLLAKSAEPEKEASGEDSTEADKDDAKNDDAENEESDSAKTLFDGMPKFDASQQIEVQLVDGCRLVGYINGGNEKFSVICKYVKSKDSRDLKFESTRVVSFTGSEARFRPDVDPNQVVSTGKLRAEGVELIGHLTAGKKTKDTNANAHSVMYWQPWASATVAAIRAQAKGEIQFTSSSRVYSVKPVAAPAALPAAPPAADQDQAIAGLIQGVFGGDNRPRPSPASVKPHKRNAPEPMEMIFQSGDSIRGVVESIDAKGMRLSSLSTETTFVPHERIHSVLLSPTRNAKPPEVEKMKRLMTVPRQMRDDPPTHLLIAPTGDFLRCRLMSMNEKFVTAEVRLQARKIPVENVSRIIWLHEYPWLEKDEEESEGDENQVGNEIADETKVDDETFLVHAIRASGRGVTFEPEQCDAETLSGASDLLGECSVSISDLSLLMFGHDVGARAAERREESWQLSLAKLPRVYDEDTTDGDTMAGKQSDLVGKRAPDVRLKTIDGKRFDLKEHRGKWIVLDFWASWCGPCIQTMPEVDKIIESLNRDDLMLVAVNLQDSETRAQVAIERMGLSGALVLMDKDGETGRFYDARAIPQTVIVDPEGIITQLFVGGGSKFLKDFEASLRENLEMPALETPAD